MSGNKISTIIGCFVILIFGGIIINTLLGEADNSSATQILTMGLSIGGILSLVGLIVYIFKGK